MELMKKIKAKVCESTLNKAKVGIAIVFASLIIAISLLTPGNENGFFITLLLIISYFACERIVTSTSTSTSKQN